MSNEVTHFKYMGGVPGASETVVFLDTVAAGLVPSAFQHWNLKRLVIDLAHDADGEVVLSKADPSGVRGTDWIEVTRIAVAAPASGTDQILLLVQPYPDFKVEWENGAAPQGTFIPDITADDEGTV